MRVAIDAAIIRNVGAVIERIVEAVRVQRVVGVVGEQQVGEILLGHRRNVVHAGFEQADLAIGRLDDRLAERERNGHDPVGEIPLAVLNAGMICGELKPPP